MRRASRHCVGAWCSDAWPALAWPQVARSSGPDPGRPRRSVVLPGAVYTAATQRGEPGRSPSGAHVGPDRVFRAASQVRYARGTGRGDGLCSGWMSGSGAGRWPVFEGDEIEAAARVLASGRVNYWTGDEGRQFEREFGEYVGVKHAVALANGTVALELALWALGIDGGEVVVPSRTFVATASAVLMRGAVPVFAEVDRDSGCVTAQTLEACLSPETRAVIVVHLGGWPCDMPAIVELCRRRGVALIEDCAQAHGATVSGRRVGSFGDA
jgi:hypothetical protein